MSISKILAATRRLVSDDKGVTAVEYGVLAALIIVVCIGAITTLGTTLSGRFANVTSSL
ncbi:MAG: Flp/Fap pilin component [Rhodospirillales bacterium]|jgi:pilus assembly protein Flp/PilA|nr:Flp/Fap pilin component [Rhodospirillales bacterium]MDB5383742.1 Flp/Fap pilin component [Rhodospirillales bacterium]